MPKRANSILPRTQRKAVGGFYFMLIGDGDQCIF